MLTRPWLTNTALAVLGLLMIGFCHQGVNEVNHFVIGFGLVAMSQALLYLVAAWVVLNGPVDRWTFLIILVCAAACRLICILAPPFLSSDIFRYVWDGKVQLAGINPYRYIPADGHLAFLRDLDVYPNINRREYAHTIYPPGAQMLFLLITRIGASVRWMKVGIVVMEMLTVWVLVKLLEALGLRREQVLLYAWHPLLIWEVASSGHIDGAALPLIALALLFYVRNKPLATGIVLAAATLIKLYPIALFPALFRRSAWRNWKMPAAVIGVVAAGYACYSSVGIGVLGFLPEYAKEEGLESGNRYFLLTLARHAFHLPTLSTAAFYVFAGLLLSGLALWAFLKSEDSPLAAVRCAFTLAAVLMFLFSSHYPWYYVWLLPFLSVIPYMPMLYYVTACFYLYTTELASPGPAMYYMFQWLYGTTAVLALYSTLREFGERKSFSTAAAV